MGKSILDQIFEEKNQAFQKCHSSITIVIPLLYELQGLLAWLTKCPAKDRQMSLEIIEERYQQITEEINSLENNILIIQKP